MDAYFENSITKTCQVEHPHFNAQHGLRLSSTVIALNFIQYSYCQVVQMIQLTSLTMKAFTTIMPYNTSFALELGFSY